MTTSLKTCFKCGTDKPVDDFYRHPQMGDGRLGKCKDCTKVDVRENRLKRADYYRKYDKERANIPHRVKARMEYQKTPDGKEALSRARQNYYRRYPLKRHAQTTAGNAIRDGRLIRQNCEICGASEHVHAHHDDYRKPLDVRWLCRKHHQEWHNNNTPKPYDREAS